MTATVQEFIEAADELIKLLEAQPSYEGTDAHQSRLRRARDRYEHAKDEVRWSVAT